MTFAFRAIISPEHISVTKAVAAPTNPRFIIIVSLFVKQAEFFGRLRKQAGSYGSHLSRFLREAINLKSVLNG